MTNGGRQGTSRLPDTLTSGHLLALAGTLRRYDDPTVSRVRERARYRRSTDVTSLRARSIAQYPWLPKVNDDDNQAA